MCSLLLPEALPEGEGADDKLAAHPEAADGEDDDDEEAPSIGRNPAPSPNPAGAGDEDKEHAGSPEIKEDAEEDIEEEEDAEEDDPDSEVQLGANGMIAIASDFSKAKE